MGFLKTNAWLNCLVYALLWRGTLSSPAPISPVITPAPALQRRADFPPDFIGYSIFGCVYSSFALRLHRLIPFQFHPTHGPATYLSHTQQIAWDLQDAAPRHLVRSHGHAAATISSTPAVYLVYGMQWFYF